MFISTLFFIATAALTVLGASLDSSSSSTSSSALAIKHHKKDVIFLPKKGHYVLVKVKSNYEAYPSTCYRNGFKPAIVSRKTLSQALNVLKEACVERAWISRFRPCRDCHLKQPKSVAFEKKLGGRVELWKAEQCAAPWYALCQKTKRRVCNDKEKCQEVSDDDSSSSSSSSSSSDSEEKQHKKHGKKQHKKQQKKHQKKQHKKHQKKHGKKCDPAKDKTCENIGN